MSDKLMTNNTNTKQNKTPVLTCLVTKETRTSNLEYLQNKASKAGVTVEEIVSNYVTREVLKNLRTGNLQGLTQEQANRILRLNGKQKSKTSSSRREAIAAYFSPSKELLVPSTSGEGRREQHLLPSFYFQVDLILNSDIITI